MQRRLDIITLWLVVAALAAIGGTWLLVWLAVIAISMLAPQFREDLRTHQAISNMNHLVDAARFEEDRLLRALGQESAKSGALALRIALLRV